MASPMRLRDELARDMHASLYLDLGAEEATSPARPSSRQRTADRLAAGGVDHTVSHGMALHLPDATENRVADETYSLRAAEEALHSSADASRMAKRKPLGAGRSAGASRSAAAVERPPRSAGPAAVTERDEKPVVDWWSDPDQRVAEAVALLSRPVCLPDPADETVRLPLDRANAELDERGYPTGRSLGGAVPTGYPLRETTMEDLGRIGGVGLRMYFTVIRGLAYVFAFLALCSIPVLISNGTGSMFDVFDARMYGCAGETCTAAECCSGSAVSDATAAAVPVPSDATGWTADCEIAARGTCGEWESAGGLCVQPSELVATLSTSFLTRLTLGNICETQADVDNGSVAALWVTACVGVCTSLALVAIVLRASSHMKGIKQDTDASMVSMSDYTVRLMPTSEHWHEYVKIPSGQGEVVKGTKGVTELTRDVEEALERAIPGAQVAEIDGKAMVVAAWDEDQNIRLWREKTVALRQLEEAIATACRAYPDRKHQKLDQALRELDRINQAENALSCGPNARRWRPVSLFVTFEQDEHCEAALKLGRIQIGAQQCLIVPADEPEAIQWANLQYSKQNRRIRRGKIHVATSIILLLGFALLIYVNVLKESAAASSDPAEKDAAHTWGVVATFAVVAINQVLKRAMIALTPYEKAHTLDEHQWGVAIRVYMCQLFNTAILMLILRSELKVVMNIPGDHFAQVNAQWYASIGSPLVATMFIQFMTPAVVKAITYGVSILKLQISAGKAQTQHALNELMAPAEFNIAASFGEVLLAATVSLLYGGGIPILYWVAAAGFTLR